MVKHRSIDDYYNQAHNSTSSEKIKSPFRRFFKRSSYYMLFVALGVANIGDAAEIGSMGFLLADETFLEFVGPGAEGIIVSSLYIGMLVGGIISGPLCDQTGRRNVLLYGLLLNSTFGVTAAIAPTPWYLLVSRFFMGLGIGAIVSCLLALTSEHTPPKHRGAYLNFVSGFWTFGSIYVAALAVLLLGFLERNWRLYTLVNAMPSIVSFGMVLIFVPESARFLALHGKHEKATTVANRIGRAMGFSGVNSLRLEEMRHHYTDSQMSSRSEPDLVTDGFWYNLCSLLKSYTKLYRRKTRAKILGVQIMWFCVSFGSGLCLWITRVFAELAFVHHIYAMTLIFAAASLPGVSLSGFVMDKVGRITLLSISLAITAQFLLVFTLLSLMVEISWLVVLFACLFHCSLVVSWSSLSVVTAEIFPTKYRSTAMGLCAASGRVASILVHLVAAPLMESGRPGAVLFAGVGAFGIAIVVSFITGFQNKTGQPLDDADEAEKTVKVEHNIAPLGLMGKSMRFVRQSISRSKRSSVSPKPKKETVSVDRGRSRSPSSLQDEKEVKRTDPKDSAGGLEEEFNKIAADYGDDEEGV